MVNLNDLFPGKTNSPSAAYPFGSARNVTVSGDGLGTPFIASLQNDIIGLQQYLINEAGITPSGSPDTALVSQQFTAIWRILNMRTLTHNFTVDADYTFTAEENLKLRYVMTDTNPFLSGLTNVIIDNEQRRFIASNETLQILKFKTLAGTGIDVDPGEFKDLYCDGTDVIDLSGGVESLLGALDTNNMIHIQDQKATTVSGGTSSVGIQTRTLNTVVKNTITGASLAANKITLPIGEYYIEAAAPVARGRAQKAFLFNISDAGNEIIGRTANIESVNDTQTDSNVSGNFTIAGIKDFEIRQYITQAQATYGLGQATSDGTIEIYTDVKIWKVG